MFPEQCAEISPHPARDVNRPCVPRTHTAARPLGTRQLRGLAHWLWWYHSARVQVAPIFLSNGPKAQSSDAGNSDMPKRWPKVLSLHKKMKVLYLINKREKIRCSVAKIYSKNKSSIHEIVQKKRKSMLFLLSHLKLPKLWLQGIVSV